MVDAIYQQTGRKLPEQDFAIPEIKAVGTYECTVRLHPEVLASFTVAIQKDKTVQVRGTQRALWRRWLLMLALQELGGAGGELS